MKTSKTTILRNVLLILTVAFFNMSFRKENPKEVVIKTSSECGMCKERIEEKLNYTKGIIFSELNISTKELRVKIKESKIGLDEIKLILSELGYDADDIKANAESQKKLPMCCQPGGMKQNSNH